MSVVLSLFDLTGNMVRPWAEAGYECYCYDIQHDERTIGVDRYRELKNTPGRVQRNEDPVGNE
mgnify:CR=1 FL=1